MLGNTLESSCCEPLRPELEPSDASIGGKILDIVALGYC